MNLLVTGANGQLGQSVLKVSPDFPDATLFLTDQPELDITDAQAVSQFLQENQITHIINCAAYTAVDQAEQQADLAFLVNETGPAVLAKSCRESGCKLIHISTDYVFSGKGYRPYKTTSPTEPQSVYAKSKSAGELAVADSGANAWIIRTSWLYSEFGNNFVKTMLRLGKDRPELRVVSDQIGSPTYAEDLARAIMMLIHQNQSSHDFGCQILHYANQGVASWYDFSTTIMELAGLTCRVEAIPTEAYPLPASRPFYSVLDTSDIRQKLDIPVPHWRVSLKKCIDILINQ